MARTREFLRLLPIALLAVGFSACALTRPHDGSADGPIAIHAKKTNSPATLKVAPEAARTMGLETIKAGMRHLQISTSVPARIEPDVGKEVDISSRVSGRVDKLTAVPGQIVKKGQLLIAITSREVSDLEAQAVAAVAKLSTARAMESREKQIYEQQVQRPKALTDASTAMREAKLQVELTRNQLHRQKTLYEEKILAAKDYISAKAAYEGALMRYEHEEANFKRETALYKDRSVLRGPYQMAQAQRITAEKELQALKSQLQFLGVDNETIDANLHKGELTGVLKIKAPITGILSFFDVAEGELVTADKPIFKITDPSTVLVRADVSESQVHLVKVGSNIHVKVAGHKNLMPAKINFISEHIDPATRTLAVRAVVPNPHNMLKTGMFAEVRLDALDTAVLAVPKSALQESNGQQIVFVKNGEQFERRPVKTGAEGAHYVEITSGLKTDEEVVTQGSLMLKTELSYSQSTQDD